MIVQQGWYNDAKHLLSPHHDSRDDESDISLLVIHNISLPPSQFGGDYIEQFFTGKLDASQHPFFDVIKEMRVSAHCLIDRKGQVIQFVPFNKRAWHAGLSSFAGRSKCNEYSIGIELEGDDYTAYTEEQYQSLKRVTRALMNEYPKITSSRITGHQYIAPLRKTDPGLVFDWRKLHRLLESD
ncbi:1,6-anhydro-N-acetylmuramyl-L-alanine amidase AmpD [Vibrio amylolyticus]|uniref:1,6-anhydro-N-acetylmuramyl-L-alanine amidase AmpD n=1 Tax=Vibrio amylolyticus TaxID=2847292 RepID=UPI00354F9EB2